MQLTQLRVINLQKRNSRVSSKEVLTPSGICPAAFTGTFLLNTCLRKVWVFSAELFPLLEKEIRKNEFLDFGSEIYRGEAAYDFLLRLACGLESEIIGETDIFGQIKNLWRDSETVSSELRSQLNSWMQKLFEDTKEIRTEYIQNIGGHSYGSLVRKLIRERCETTGKKQPILLVGAGKLAESIAPYLFSECIEKGEQTSFELILQNRSIEKAWKLSEELYKKARIDGNTNSFIKILKDDEEVANSWKKAAHIIVCIPFEELEDAERIAWFKEGCKKDGPRTIIHLGGLRAEAGKWNEVEGFFSLDEIFNMQKLQNEVRDVKIAKAREACLMRSRHRSLGGSLSVAHGWEDLAAFY